jgi:hypothetical protein
MFPTNTPMTRPAAMDTFSVIVAARVVALFLGSLPMSRQGDKIIVHLDDVCHCLGGCRLRFVRRQSFSEKAGAFVMEALVRFLVQLRLRQTGVASGAAGWSVS